MPASSVLSALLACGGDGWRHGWGSGGGWGWLWGPIVLLGWIAVIAGVTVDFRRRGFTAIMGPSGSGKSTLLHCLAGLDLVSSGQVWLGDTQVDTLGDRGLTRLRRERVGFVFQMFNLLPTLTAEENITLPLAIGSR